MQGMQRQLRGLVERIVVAVPEAQPGSAEAAGTVTDAVNNGFEFVAHQHKPGINRKVYRAQGYNLRMNPKSRHGRSEEHTSELQSLMRISYAVFCLKKKT